MSVHKNIARIRRERGLTQEQLAKATGFSESYISAIEEGRGHPRARTLEVIARCLGVEMEELLSEQS